MAIATHLPPPVMIESTPALAFITHILCWSCGMYFSAARTSENDQGSINFASKTTPGCSTIPPRGGAAPRRAGCGAPRPPLHLRNDGPSVATNPRPMGGLGQGANLDEEIVGEALRLGPAAFRAPQPK